MRQSGNERDERTAQDLPLENRAVPAGAELPGVVANLSADPAYLAWAFAQWQRQHLLADAALAARLGIPPARLPLLAVCRRPASAAELQEVSATFGIAPDALAAVLREADTAAARERHAA